MADDDLDMQENDNGSEEQQDKNSDDHDASSTDDYVTSTSSAARDELRQSMEDDVAAFLARGGQIQEIDDNVMADPPRKPQTSYGSRPI